MMMTNSTADLHRPSRIVARPVKVKIGKRWTWQYLCDNGLTYSCKELAEVIKVHEMTIPKRIRRLGGYDKEGVLEPGDYQWPGAVHGHDGARQKPAGKKVVLRPGEIFLRQCPETCNLPSRYQLESFAWACLRRQGLRSRDGNVVHDWCQICKGQELPPGLELVDTMEDVMSTKRELGSCWLCQEKKLISKCYGKDLCPTCGMLVSAVKNRPQVVIKAMEEYGTLVTADVSAADAAALGAAGQEIEKLREDIARRQAQNLQLCEDLVKLQASESALRDDVARLQDLTFSDGIEATLAAVSAERDDMFARLRQAEGIEATLAAVSAERDDLVARLRQAEAGCSSLPLLVDFCRLDAIAWQIARGMATREKVDFQWDDVEYLRGLSGAATQ